ncbi:MAG TPA: Calx-beta domain-containing protein, partial [Verrucomicrobiae bacterium]
MALVVGLGCGLAPRAAAQPVNDHFTNATIIVGPLGSVFGSTVNATQEPGEPVHWNFFQRPGASQHSAWYRWIAPATGFITFETGGSGYDTVLSAYTGTALSSLVRIASDDDGLGFSLQSLMTFFAAAGTEYYIAVDGYDYGEPFGTRSGFFFLNWFGAGGTNTLGPTDIQFSAGNFQVYENTPGFVTITVVSGAGFTTGGTIDYYTSDGTAIAGTDYLSASNTLTFAAGDTFKTFTIPILDNSLQHSNKTIVLTLTNATGEVTLGAMSNSIVTILDDETPPFVSPAGVFNIVWPDLPLQATSPPLNVSLPFGFGLLFGAFPQYVVTENETFTFATGPSATTVNQYPGRSARGAVITVQRSSPAVGRVLVDYYTTNLFVTNLFFTNIFNLQSNPIARPFFDFTPVSGTLVFDDYQMSANFVVPVSTPLFTNVYFNVVLANPRPAPEEDSAVIVPTLGPTNFATVEIMRIDTIPRINFERTTWRVDEYRSTPQGTTNVIIPGDNFIDIDVIYPPGGPNVSATISVTSRRYIHPLLPGSDYIDPLGITFDNTVYTDSTPLVLNQEDVRTTTFTASFGANQRRDSIRIPIANDGVTEFNEDIYLEITGTSPGGLAGINRFATVTICYNNQPAGAADREWNPEGVVYTNPRFYNTPGANSTVNAVAVQPDNKSLIAGDFDHVNSFTRNYVARFNFDGSLDASFNPGTGADGPVDAMVLYPAGSTNTGKILLGGVF